MSKTGDETGPNGRQSVKKQTGKEKKQNNNLNVDPEQPPQPPKKRGRKPKGGKIIKVSQSSINDKPVIEEQIVIAHFKCTYAEMKEYEQNITKQISQYNPNIEVIEPYNDTECKNNYSFLNETSSNEPDNGYSIKKSDTNTDHENNILGCNLKMDYGQNENYEIVHNSKLTEHSQLNENQQDTTDKNRSCSSQKENVRKIINAKLKELEMNLNMKTVNKESACFWCTYEFSSPPVYIPTLYFEQKYDVYGCFCSPECACSYLFKEEIDNNTKFERYQLLNYLYGKIYKYKKNIKPAPNPYYTLSKFYGNLNIQEYRQLLEYDRLLLVIDKPLTKIYPELHEDNNDFETIYETKISLKKNEKVKKSKVLTSVFSGK